MNEPLAPCPFCGVVPYAIQRPGVLVAVNHGKGWQSCLQFEGCKDSPEWQPTDTVECRCGARQALAAWNTRPDKGEPVAMVGPRQPWDPLVLWPDDKLAEALRADANCQEGYDHPGAAALLRRAADFVDAHPKSLVKEDK